VVSTTISPSGSRAHVLRLNTLDDRPSLFRLWGTTGPILGSLPFKATRVRKGGETALIRQQLNEEEGVFKTMMPVVVNGMHEGVSIRFDIFIGGVCFEDGSISKTLHVPDDFNERGEAIVNFIKIGSKGANCYRSGVWHQGVRVAYFE
jgi:hypothetical protein